MGPIGKDVNGNPIYLGDAVADLIAYHERNGTLRLWWASLKRSADYTTPVKDA